MSDFRQCDSAALRSQNTFYLVQLIFAVGVVVATILGALPPVLGRGQPVLGVIEAAVAALLGTGALIAYSQGAQRAYYTKRLQAERLRSEYFLFLGGVGPYVDEAKSMPTLRQRVAEITV